MKEKLQEIKETNQLIAVYTNKLDTTRFMVGLVTNASDYCAVLKLVDPEGRFDGYALFQIDGIYQLESDNKYLKELQELMNKSFKADIEFHSTNEDIFTDFVLFLQKNKIITNFRFFDSGYDDATGIIKDITQNEIIITCIDNGKPDGESILKIDDLTALYTK